MSLASPLAPRLSLSSHLPISLSTSAASDRPGGASLQAQDKPEGVWILQEEGNRQVLQTRLLETDAHKSHSTP